MDEIEKITKAKMYIEKLANGENPINNQKVADNDVVNNIDVTRCLFYVANILDENSAFSPLLICTNYANA